ncbi:RNA polymerase sigma factor SigJ [Kitasatospora sp. NPDC050543]|uniref:RNA polymerase sigma factor SigJ n=1 Tax=Kitasatospora sp. NPDC050543 TaxID=3364054 RepID=UPI0037AC1CB2
MSDDSSARTGATPANASANTSVSTPADAFEAQRRYLGSVAYRLLGSLTDAEDVLQEAWLRWRAADRSAVDDPRAYLTTVVTRLCYDLLGSARVRRESYFGEWLPEPLVSDEDTPAQRAELGESVSLALLAVLEQLTPAERAAFVLHDVFSVGFDEIAASLERTPDAARQLASRARRRVRAGGRRGPVDPAEHRQVVRAFAAATAGGDIRALLDVLDPDVVWHSDGGGIVSAGARPVFGADKVSRLVAGLARKFADTFGVAFALVNGEPGLLFHDADGTVGGVLALTVADGRITEAHIVVNPQKLTHVTRVTVTP